MRILYYLLVTFCRFMILLNLLNIVSNNLLPKISFITFVLYVTKKYVTPPNSPDIDTIKIVALYHDICKANFYEESQKNVKDKKTGQWKSVPYYTVNEQYPYGGHGAKSVYLLMAHGVPLTEEEAAAINCHMGGWDYTTYHNPSNAFEKYPLAVYLHIADMLASYIDKS